MIDYQVCMHVPTHSTISITVTAPSKISTKDVAQFAFWSKNVFFYFVKKINKTGSPLAFWSKAHFQFYVLCKNTLADSNCRIGSRFSLIFVWTVRATRVYARPATVTPLRQGLQKNFS
jgi:hypothetical protein